MSLFEQSLQAYAFARSAVFKTESIIGPAIDMIINRRLPQTKLFDADFIRHARNEMNTLLKDDVANIAAGVYPLEVLKPGNPIKHMMRMPVLFKDIIDLSRRRGKKSAHVFSKKAQDLLSGLPEYYQRNFHFQDDGYLSDRSADLYEHQVEILFAGSADAMRRLIIKPLKERFPGDGTGLTFLELGAGTGRTTRFVRLAFPKAKIVAVDLSAPYLRRAQAELIGFNHNDFVEANASDLPFKDQTFDAVYSVFLFHELPLREREAVMRESNRVLKPGGFHGLVDSIQTGDTPAFDEALELFPVNFHEPFYKNYIQKPIQGLLEASGVQIENVSKGFFSKCVSGRKVDAL